jgi:hypothetical protein
VDVEGGKDGDTKNISREDVRGEEKVEREKEG